MYRLCFDEAQVAKFVGAGIEHSFQGPYTAIGVQRDGALVGGVVFNNFNGWNIEITAVGARAFQRGAIRAMAHYCFEQLKCHRITAKTRRDNTAARHALETIGFVREAELSRYFGPSTGHDAVVYRLTLDDLPRAARPLAGLK